VLACGSRAARHRGAQDDAVILDGATRLPQLARPCVGHAGMFALFLERLAAACAGVFAMLCLAAYPLARRRSLLLTTYLHSYSRLI